MANSICSEMSVKDYAGFEMNDCTFNASLIEQPVRWSRCKAWAVWVVVGLWTWVGLAALLYWVVE